MCCYNNLISVGTSVSLRCLEKERHVRGTAVTGERETRVEGGFVVLFFSVGKGGQL